ncbi:MAG: hypothetical protein NVS4B3_27510 [Gemmatimonadaceae bacterium]
MFAAARGELFPHAGVHVGLTLLGAYLVWRLAPMGRRGGSVISGLTQEHTERLTHLEQSVDAMAIEVERIGEGQRFMTRVFTEKDTPRVPAESVASPIEKKGPEGSPPVRRD